MNYYQVLGVEQTATEQEIKIAYRNMIKAFHPDYYNGNAVFAEAKTKEINEAYEVLKDSDKRKNYDIYLSQLNASSQGEILMQKKRAEEAERKRREAEQKAETERKRFEEEQKKRIKAEELYNANNSSDMQPAKKELTVRTAILYIIAIVVGFVVFIISSIILDMIITFIAKIPILNLLVAFMINIPFSKGLGVVVLETLVAGFCAFFVASTIMKKANQKYKWGYIGLAICIILLSAILYARPEKTNFWGIATYVLNISMITHSFINEA